MITKSKIFYQILLEHSFNVVKAKKLIASDRRLTRDEKTILKCFLLMRENNNTKALELVEEVRPQTEPLVESMRFFILGGLLNCFGMQEKSHMHYLASYKHLPKGQDTHLEFVIMLNLYIISVNQRNLKNITEFISIMNKMQGLNEEDILTLTKCNFNYATITVDLKKAQKLYLELEKNKTRFKSHTLISYYFNVWDFALVKKDVKLCEKVLEQIQDQRVYSSTQNYNYMKLLLNHYFYDKPVFINEQIYRNFPKLLAELKLIRALETNKMSEAQGQWKQLERFNPFCFKPDFKFVGHTTILSLCLKKHEAKLTATPSDIKVDPKKSITDNIKSILLENKSITKDDLFVALFGRAAESKLDYARLAREIYKCKSQFKFEIDSKKGKYSLIKAA